MDISNFSSYFELFAALNLAYAGSGGFRNVLNNDILDIREAKKKLVSSIDSFESFIVVTGSEGTKKVTSVDFKKKFQSKLDKILSAEEDFRYFEESFKSMFLITSFFCIAILLIGGFEHEFFDQETPGLLAVFCSILLFNLYVFLNSLFIKSARKKIKPIITLSIFFGICSIAVIFLYYCPHYKIEFTYYKKIFLYWMVIFIAVSPYFFHVIRAVIHRSSFKRKFITFDQEFSEYSDDGLFGANDSMLKDLDLDC
jgi:hypothetical protein